MSIQKCKFNIISRNRGKIFIRDIRTAWSIRLFGFWEFSIFDFWSQIANSELKLSGYQNERCSKPKS